MQNETYCHIFLSMVHNLQLLGAEYNSWNKYAINNWKNVWFYKYGDQKQKHNNGFNDKLNTFEKT